MSEQFDTIVVGMGPGGESAAGRLLAAGQRVAVIEQELIGGECGYWACIPSKILLRPPEARGEVDRAAGVDGARLDWAGARTWRDDMIRHLDDSNEITGYENSGATVIKGPARITGPGAIEVNDRTLRAEHLIPAGYFDGLITLLDRAVEDGFLDASTRKGVIVERDPVVLLERLLPALAAD